MSQYDMAQAKAQLPDLARKALAGEEVIIITGGDAPPVKLVPMEPPRAPRKPGSGSGQLLWMAPDFDATLEGFENYSAA
jgi:antitoxin (DNA-binding transcriptional repressor) of toxin-antitoxin stability system